MEVVALPSVTSLQVAEHVREHYPLFPPDNRIIVWDLHRPRIGTDTSYAFHRKNRWVVPHTKPLTACLGTNSATYVLGSSEQAKGTLYYLMDYIVKNPTACANTLSLIYEARMHTQKYGSRAEDAHTAERKATYFLNRIVNQISAKSEISVMMASAALLGIKSSVSSHKFVYVYIQPAITFVKWRLQHPILRDEGSDPEMNEDEEEKDALALDEGGDLMESFSADNFKAPPSNTAGELYHVNGKYVAIPSHIHYAYRGIYLQMLSFYEYCPMIQVVKKTTAVSTTNGRYLFDCRHPLFATHEQMQQSASS
jgi:hypothetical protein